MKTRIYILALLSIISFLGIAQDKFTAQLPIRGGTEGFAISKNEKVWVATKTGNTYFTEKLGNLWYFGTLISQDEFSDELFNRVNYVADSTLIISGYMQGGDNKTNFIYRSTDNGKTWKKVIFGRSSWIDTFYSNGKGKIWMSGSSQLIYYSNDYGKTWKAFDKIEKKGNLRFSTIHFSKDDSIGLFGSFWDVIYKTTDNCKTWQKIPTPLSQKKYSRLSKQERPDIRKIRIFNDFIIVNQQGRIFYTKKDSINWMQIPDMIDFEVTKSRQNIYFINNDLSIQTFDNNLKPKWKSNKRLSNLSLIETQNENLYVFTYSDIYHINQNDFSKYELLTNEVPIPEPTQKLTYRNELVGFEGSNILKYDATKSAWYNYMKAPFQIENAALFDNKLIITAPSLKNRYRVELNSKNIAKFSLPKKIFDTDKNNIVSIRFEEGSQGCFHNNLTFKEYKLKRNVLKLKDRSKKGFEELPRTFDVDKINAFVQLIDSTRNTSNSKNDLKITENDISNYVEFIKKEAEKMETNGYDSYADYENLYHFPGENTDFSFYINTIKHFENIPDDVINKMFNRAYGNWSTTRDWNTITIKFNDNSVLTISNSDDKPNYLNLPWIIEYNGLIFKNNSIKLGEFIADITNGTMFNKEALSKKYALFKIADFLYKQQINH